MEHVDEEVPVPFIDEFLEYAGLRGLKPFTFVCYFVV